MRLKSIFVHLTLLVCVVVGLAAFNPAIQNAFGQSARPEEVTFPSGKLMLHGFIYRPRGAGPFPTILYNHGSEAKPGWKSELGEFFSSKGYVFFVPHRRGQGRSPNDSYVESLRAQGAAGAIALHETHLEEQLAALAYLNSERTSI